jgi:hypothetical protein
MRARVFRFHERVTTLAGALNADIALESKEQTSPGDGLIMQ